MGWPHPLEDDLLRGLDVQDGDAVARVALLDRAQHLLVPRAVAQRAVHPAVLACQQRRLLSDLDDVTRLVVRVVAGGEPVARDVPRPLGQGRLDLVRVDLHDVVQREDAALGQPFDRARLACTHRACCEDDPRMRLLRTRARVEEPRHQPVLKHLPRLRVDPVVSRVERVSDRCEPAVRGRAAGDLLVILARGCAVVVRPEGQAPTPLCAHCSQPTHAPTHVVEARIRSRPHRHSLFDFRKPHPSSVGEVSIVRTH